MRASVLSLAAANAVTLLLAALAYGAYSGLLSPAEFGLYAIALSASRIATLILDGGMRAALVRLGRALDRREEAVLLLVAGGAGILLAAVTVLAAHLAGTGGRVAAADARFVAAYVLPYALTYALVIGPTARLEREMRFGSIAVIEGASLAIELAAPAVLLLTTTLGMQSFVLAALVSRLVRVAGLLAAGGTVPRLPDRASFAAMAPVFRDGLLYQAGLIASAVRDSLPALLIGPLFGKAWVGFYTWAIQACVLGSQAFALAVARVGVPGMARMAEGAARWDSALVQMRWLAIATAPVLAAIWLAAPWADAALFDSRWQPALEILPWLLLRMLPGTATTVLGSLVVVQAGGRAAMRVALRWTGVEIGLAVAAVQVFGPMGLAYSYALGAWFGLAFQLRELGKGNVRGWREVLAATVGRRSLWVAFGIAAIVAAGLVPGVFAPAPALSAAAMLALCGAIVVLAYLSEPPVRQRLALQWAR